MNGLEILHGDILLNAGLIKRVGVIEESELEGYAELAHVDAQGKWVSPG